MGVCSDKKKKKQVTVHSLSLPLFDTVTSLPKHLAKGQNLSQKSLPPHTQIEKKKKKNNPKKKHFNVPSHQASQARVSVRRFVSGPRQCPAPRGSGYHHP